ncbi:hypothetical protein NBRC10512_002670 [Rhodotorula toruloides]|uniref:RHTO0S14e00826g1_1 n=2 Tax=Rhodotorula toruloides TaxID=5286 RepID=A0A061BD01_RHOTO|nr:transcription factor [Rhodotorula toruloides NP11]EMS24743.1 transcription factor [Rhodotorula toruloides NP11]CDR47227.1 RHTO0S14e00826g1_1 [Rhodotorula toruloides]
MRQKASVEVAPAQLDSMKVCKPCHARKVLCDLARPVCSACLRYSKERPSHRCEYGPNAAMPGEAKSLRPDRSLDVDETFQPLPRTRSAARALLGPASSRPAPLSEGRTKEEDGTGSGEGPANDAVPTPETSRALLNDVLLSPSHSVPASLVYASGTVSSNQSGGAVSAGQTGEAPPEPAALSGTPPATAPSSRFLGSNSQQPTVPTYLPLALLTPNQQLLPPTAPPVPFISIFQPEAPESVDTSTPPSRRISIVGGQSAADTRLPFAPPLPPRSTSALGAQLPALPPLPAVHAHAANGPASFAPPLCPKFPSIPDARSRQSTSPHRDFARRARAEPPAATQPHPHDSTTFANVDFSSDYSSRRPTEQPQHTFLPLVPPRPASGGLNAVLATGTSSSFDTLYAYN